MGLSTVHYITMGHAAGEELSNPMVSSTVWCHCDPWRLSETGPFANGMATLQARNELFDPELWPVNWHGGPGIPDSAGNDVAHDARLCAGRTAGVLHHERDLLGGHLIRSDDQVALVLAVLVIQHEHKLAVGDGCQGVRYGVKSAGGGIKVARGCRFDHMLRCVLLFCLCGHCHTHGCAPGS